MCARFYVAFVTMVMLAFAGASALAGTLKLRVRDGQTGFAVQATVRLEGPESLTLQTDGAGLLTRTVLTGVYRIQLSAPGYEALRTHTEIQEGSNSLDTIVLPPVSPPAEESPQAVGARVRPGYTLLHGYVDDDDFGRPLPGVKVRLVIAGVETLTDSRGHFFLSVLTPTPAKRDWMGTDTVILQKPGYQTQILEHFGIAGEDVGVGYWGLNKGSGVIHSDATHKLMRQGGAPSQEEPQSAKPGGRSLSPELQKWLDTKAAKDRTERGVLH